MATTITTIIPTTTIPTTSFSDLLQLSLLSKSENI
jgi:hypothetical protein